MISVKDYPAATAPGLLDDLLRLPYEMVRHQSFAFVDRQAALDRMDLALRRMRAADDEALSPARASWSQAKDDVAAGRAAFGEHHLTVMVARRQPRRRWTRPWPRSQAALDRDRRDRGARGRQPGARLLGPVPRQLQGTSSAGR